MLIITKFYFRIQILCTRLGKAAVFAQVHDIHSSIVVVAAQREGTSGLKSNDLLETAPHGIARHQIVALRLGRALYVGGDLTLCAISENVGPIAREIGGTSIEIDYLQVRAVEGGVVCCAVKIRPAFKVDFYDSSGTNRGSFPSIISLFVAQSLHIIGHISIFDLA